MTDSLEAWIQSFKSGKTWFNKLLSEDTKKSFLSDFKLYCDAVGKNPDELISLKEEGLKNIATEKEFQAERLLEDFFANCNLKDSVKMMLKSSVISFYKHNWRNLNPNVASNIQKPESKHRCPSIQDVQDLDNAMTCQRDKAILWFFASTAIRIGTVLKLKWKDLKPTGDKQVPFQLLIESARLKGSGIGKYRGVKQVAFMHSLAVQKLEAYKKEAERKGYKLNDESPIFVAYNKGGKITPLLENAIGKMFSDGSLVAWHDLEVKRFSPQDFRDFLQSKLESAGINSNIISPMLSHKVKGVDFHYSQHEIGELLQKFKTALPYLLPQTVEKLKVETEKDQKRIAELEKEVAEQKQNVAALVKDVVENRIAEIKRLIPNVKLKEVDAVLEGDKDGQ
jgi:site-specific recombinase XerD